MGVAGALGAGQHAGDEAVWRGGEAGMWESVE